VAIVAALCRQVQIEVTIDTMTLPPRTSFFELVAAVARRAPERPAALSATEQVTYADLAARAERVAAAMQARGLGAGSRIGLLCNNRVAWLEVLLATSRIGGTLVPISTWSTPSELAFILGDCRVDALFTLHGFGGQNWRAGLEADRPVKRIVSIEGEVPSGWDDYADYAAHAPTAALPPQPRVAPDAPFEVLYTSGSSSRPKAVPLVERTILENGFDIGERQGLGPDDRVLVSIPLFWSYGAANALPATLTHGATLILQSRFEPAGALDLIERFQATAIYTLPAMTSALIGHASFAPARTRSLRTGLTIGSPQDVVRAATELGISELCNVYGSTETYGNCCVTPHDWPLERRSTCQGPPLPGMRLRIRDGESGKLLPHDEIGQIEVAGYLTPGYLYDSARHNTDVFTPDGWFRTGDLGRLQADGTIVYAGRSSEMIKRSGINVSPAEVEEVLQQHADVALAAVTGAPDTVRGEIIIAYVIARPGAAPSADVLLAFCRERLSSYKLPDRIIAATELPLTPTGKLMRRELKAIAARVSV
jgi:fatty-acyl-CoA synthase